MRRFYKIGSYSNLQNCSLLKHSLDENDKEHKTIQNWDQQKRCNGYYRSPTSKILHMSKELALSQ